MRRINKEVTNYRVCHPFILSNRSQREYFIPIIIWPIRAQSTVNVIFDFLIIFVFFHLHSIRLHVLSNYLPLLLFSYLLLLILLQIVFYHFLLLVSFHLALFRFQPIVLLKIYHLLLHHDGLVQRFHPFSFSKHNILTYRSHFKRDRSSDSAGRRQIPFK